VGMGSMWLAPLGPRVTRARVFCPVPQVDAQGTALDVIGSAGKYIDRIDAALVDAVIDGRPALYKGQNTCSAVRPQAHPCSSVGATASATAKPELSRPHHAPRYPCQSLAAAAGWGFHVAPGGVDAICGGAARAREALFGSEVSAAASFGSRRSSFSIAILRSIQDEYLFCGR